MCVNSAKMEEDDTDDSQINLRKRSFLPSCYRSQPCTFQNCSKGTPKESQVRKSQKTFISAVLLPFTAVHFSKLLERDTKGVASLEVSENVHFCRLVTVHSRTLFKTARSGRQTSLNSVKPSRESSGMNENRQESSQTAQKALKTSFSSARIRKTRE